MKPWGKVSSIPGANTLFEGQQTNGQTQKRQLEERRKEKRHKQIGETQKREHR
jgi:hypothetical protein